MYNPTLSQTRFILPLIFFIGFIPFVGLNSIRADFTWSSVFPVPPSVEYQDAAYGDGVWVIAGANTIVSTNDDGASWSTTITGESNDIIDGVLYTGSRFILFGAQWIDNSQVVLLWESFDGFNWNRIDPSRISSTGNADKQRLLAGAVSDDGETIILGGFQGALFRSTDGGETWTGEIYLENDPSGHANFGLIISDVAYGSGTFVFIQHTATDGLAISTSTDLGTTWNYNKTGEPINAEAIGYGNGEFLIAGSEANTFNVKALKSTDGLTWTTHDSELVAGIFYDIEFGNGSWYASPSWPTDLHTSTDGITWTAISGTGGTTSTYGICYANNTFIATGSSPKRSTDGVTWDRLANGPEGEMRAASYGDGTWVAVGSKGSALYSNDNGLTWNDSSPDSTSQIYDILWDGTNFVAMGAKSWISSNGKDWTNHSLGGFQPLLNTIAYGNGIYFAAGNNNQMRRSTDGQNWTTLTLPIMASGRDVIYADNQFILVTENWLNPNPQLGQIFTSPDAQTWTQVGPTDRRPFKNLAYGNGTVVVMGLNGFFGQSSILSSKDMQTWTESTLMMDPGFIFHDGTQFIAVGTKIYTSVDGENWKVEIDNPITPYLTGAALEGQTLLGLSTGGSVYRASLDIEAPGALDLAQGLGEQWYSLNWFGLFYKSDTQADWIFHEEMGWFRYHEEGAGLWLWNPTTRWVYTDAPSFPFAYSLNDNTWWFFDAAEGWVVGW